MVRLPVRSIVGAIAAAAARWSDAKFPPRARASDGVAARTGYSRPAVDHALDLLFGALRADAIESVISDELGSLDALDGFVSKGGRPPAYARPLGRVCIVSSRTTIGVALVPAVFALCAKCDVLVKDREDALVAAFFATLAQECGDLGEAARAHAWRGESEAAALAAFDAVVAFGTDERLAEIARGLPFATRFIPYGSKASVGYIARESLADERAAQSIGRGAARDLVLYESEGCLSLHALFVERGGAISPERFAEIFAAEVRAAAIEFPVGENDACAASRRAAARDLATYRSGGKRVYSNPPAGYLAVVDPPLDRPPLFLPLAIGVHTVSSPHEAEHYLSRHAIAVEALAVSERRQDLLDLAVTVGAARVAAFGALQAPVLGGFHGGRPRIAEFVRWIADET
ncbi:MAG TPA: acyl-CoA reductase [Candidatus Binatia bacterium]|nr:acyl-CoA reductase [Candidatus Binatia bacterium]